MRIQQGKKMKERERKWCNRCVSSDTREIKMQNEEEKELTMLCIWTVRREITATPFMGEIEVFARQGKES